MLPGMLYLVSIRMVPLVPRGPVGKVYGDVTEAFYVDLTLYYLCPVEHCELRASARK